MLHNAGRSQRARWEFTDLQVDKDMFDLVKHVSNKKSIKEGLRIN